MWCLGSLKSEYFGTLIHVLKFQPLQKVWGNPLPYQPSIAWRDAIEAHRHSGQSAMFGFDGETGNKGGSVTGRGGNKGGKGEEGG